MPNDAKLGLVTGLALVLLIAMTYYRKDPPAVTATEPAKSPAPHSSPGNEPPQPPSPPLIPPPPTDPFAPENYEKFAPLPALPPLPPPSPMDENATPPLPPPTPSQLRRVD